MEAMIIVGTNDTIQVKINIKNLIGDDTPIKAYTAQEPLPQLKCQFQP